MIRPDELENINYIDYFKDYEVILKSSKRKLPIKAKSGNALPCVTIICFEFFFAKIFHQKLPF
jgi:hypothetical protein